ncbi:8591_t:CDS:2, partial [Cetraspora pellucida]
QNLNNHSNIDLKNINSFKDSKNISRNLENISNVEDAENIKIVYLKDTANVNDLEDMTNVNNLDYVFGGFPYSNKKLYKNLNQSVMIKKARLLCSTNHTKFCEKEYQKYDPFSLMNWDTLFDFTFVRQHVRVISHGYNFDVQTIKKFLNFTTKEIYYFFEKGLYEVQYFDTDDTNLGMGYRYQKKYFISNLKSRPETLIHLGTTFGSRKIVLEQRKNIDLYYGLHANLKFGHMALDGCVKKIVEELGGRKSFISTHLRKEWVDSPYNDSKEYPNVMKASDSKDPKQDFQKIYSNFNYCVFTLSDFKKHLEPLRDLYNDIDNYSLYSFFICFVDLLVASNGGIFIGTLNSTFSR